MTSRRARAAAKHDVEAVVATLRRMGSKAVRDGMARYAIPSDRAFGISMSAMQKYARELGHDHELALALWATGWYEARTVAAFVDEIEKVTPAQMDRWAADFDNWAICDTVCFKLFDRSPHAFAKISKWGRSREEYVKRAAFALLASVALHDKESGDDSFLPFLPLLESGAADGRNFVKKGVLWALRGVGGRSVALQGEAVRLATRLAESPTPSARWVGKSALRELEGSAASERLERKEAKKAGKAKGKRR
jgi:3-methyladenine DNA glycosylase AlkD